MEIEKKRLCFRLRSGDKHHLGKSWDRKAQISSVGVTNASWFVLFDLKIFSGGVFPPAQPHAQSLFSIIGSAEALPILCVRYFRWERERERERYRQRRKWRHHYRAKIGDEFTLSLAKLRTIGDELTLSLAKNSHFSFLPSHFPSLHSRRGHHCGAEIFAMSSHFPLPTFPSQKFALFVSPFTLPVSPFAERSPLWRWNSQWVHTFQGQKCFRPQALFPLFQKFFRPQALFLLFQIARAARRVIENPRLMIKSCLVLFFFPLKKWIKLIPKTIGNRKRDCAWGTIGERERETEVVRRK